MFKIFTRIIYISYIFIKFKMLCIFLDPKNIKNINERKIRKGFEKLGPTFIKLAQIISLRGDFYNENILRELEKLQTEAICFNFKAIKIIIEKALSKNINVLFKKINKNPLSSASVAQLHSAIMQNGDKVIIKIIKPNTKNLIYSDLKVIALIFNILILFKKFDRFKLLDVLDELENTFNNELNLKYEAANISKFRHLFNTDQYVYAPNVYWHLCSENILVMEYVDGINILNKNKLKKEQINNTTIIFQLIEIFYTQFLKYNFFHADLHPGNILISKSTMGKNVIILIDFGIVSFMENEQKYYIIENILAFTKMDYKKIIQLHINAKTIKLNNKNAEIENELRFIFDPILNKRLKDLSFSILVKQLVRLSKKVNMQLQPNFLLFQKNLILIEGITRQLDQNINLWLITRQVIEKLFINTLFVNKIKHNLEKIMYPKNNNKQIFTQKNLFNKITEYIILEYILLCLSFYCVILIMIDILLKYYKYIIFFI